MPEMAYSATNKSFLRSIIAHDYQLPSALEPFDFAVALLHNIASPDSELRDDLSYMILASGIIDRQKLTSDQLEMLLQLCLNQDHLFSSVGEVGTDSVFMRSFSCLIVAAILYTDARAQQLSRKAMQQTWRALLRYSSEERDWRGYINGKGWAHAMAHLAEALDDYAQHPLATEVEREQIMVTVRDLAKLPEPLYFEEDTRLAMVSAHIMLGKQVKDNFLAHWLSSCLVQRTSNVASWSSAINMKNFLRSLYFFLYWEDMALPILEDIALLLNRQDQVYFPS